MCRSYNRAQKRTWFREVSVYIKIMMNIYIYIYIYTYDVWVYIYIYPIYVQQSQLVVMAVTSSEASRPFLVQLCTVENAENNLLRVPIVWRLPLKKGSPKGTLFLGNYPYTCNSHNFVKDQSGIRFHCTVSIACTCCRNRLSLHRLHTAPTKVLQDLWWLKVALLKGARTWINLVNFVRKLENLMAKAKGTEMKGPKIIWTRASNTQDYKRTLVFHSLWLGGGGVK